MRKATSALLLLSLCTALSACSGEPSESNLTKAVEASLVELNGMVEQMSGKPAEGDDAMKLYSLKKSECAQMSGEPAYRCAVELDVDLPFIGRQTMPRILTVMKGDDGWRVVGGLNGG